MKNLEECLLAYRQELRQLLHENGVASNPAVDDEWILEKIRELVNARKPQTQNAAPLTVAQIVDKLAELSEKGTKAVCLTYEGDSANHEHENLACDHFREIALMAREQYPFFGHLPIDGVFTLGQRGCFWAPPGVRNLWPESNECVNFPISEV